MLRAPLCGAVETPARAPRVGKYVRPGTEQEWQARCGDKYIPVGAGRYAAELGSDSDEANDACARRRNCMEQRMAYGYSPAPGGQTSEGTRTGPGNAAIWRGVFGMLPAVRSLVPVAAAGARALRHRHGPRRGHVNCAGNYCWWFLSKSAFEKVVPVSAEL